MAVSDIQVSVHEQRDNEVAFQNLLHKPVLGKVHSRRQPSMAFRPKVAVASDGTGCGCPHLNLDKARGYGRIGKENGR